MGGKSTRSMGNASMGGRSAGAMSAEEMQHVRYMAHMERRARPPTFRPLTIVVVVLSLGLFIIGLVMIVIAHWPGVSGGDSMKIAGGVLISVGGTIFIITMIVTCVLRNRERDRFEKSIANLQASRSQASISVISRRTPQSTPTPSVHAQPGKSILKKTPSTSTYGTNRGSVFGEEDSGVPYNNSFGHQSYEGNSSNSDNSAGKYEVYRIETLPDPSMVQRGTNGSLPQKSQLVGSGILGSGSLSGAGLLHSSTDSEAQGIPTPVRNTKKRRAQSPGLNASNSGRNNPSYSADPDEIDVTQPPQKTSTGRSMQQYGDGGYDMYEAKKAAATSQAPSRPSNPPATKPKPQESYDSDTTASVVPQPVRKKKRDPESAEKRRQRQQMDQSGASYGAYDSTYQNAAFQPPEADLGYQQTTTTTTRQYRTTQQSRPVHNTSQSSMDGMRINIHPQPGSSVHITPTETRVQRKPRPAPSESSVETEI